MEDGSRQKLIDGGVPTDEFLEHLGEYQEFVEEGKLRINEGLYALVPPWMTMGEFDVLTGVVFEKIRDAWEDARGKTDER